MKEAYFQEGKISSLSTQWMDKFSAPSREVRQPLEPTTSALLILDMQEYFLREESHAFIPAARAIIPGLNRVIHQFREAERPVLASRHANSRENAAMMASWWAELLTLDHPLGAIDPDLDIRSEEIFLKAQYDAFYRSPLAGLLAADNVRQLVIGGVMTHLCCETTARAAFVRGYQVFFLADGTATYNADLHTASLRNLAHGCAVLTTTERVIGRF
jgi:isochorismate hydrolase